MKYKFIGDDTDALTARWGLKTGEVYEVKKRPGLINAIVARISTKKLGEIICPYNSERQFKANWEEIK